MNPKGAFGEPFSGPLQLISFVTYKLENVSAISDHISLFYQRQLKVESLVEKHYVLKRQEQTNYLLKMSLVNLETKLSPFF